LSNEKEPVTTRIAATPTAYKWKTLEREERSPNKDKFGNLEDPKHMHIKF